jgi:O-antigen/teichoic acid export membrane protein
MEKEEQAIERDRYSLNMVAESISRALSFIGGLVSTTILWRSVAAGSWTIDDYGVLKVLANVNQLLLPIILLGITGALTRIIADYSSNRRRLGQTIGVSLVIITIAYITTAFVSIAFNLDILLLGDQAQAVDVTSLRLFWFTIIITLLPTAYLRIVKASFSGMQLMKRTLYVDITYNSLRIVLLIGFFFSQLVTIINILLMNLALGVFASAIAFYILVREMKRNEIPWGFSLDNEVLKKLSRLSAVFLLSSLVTASLNNVTVLWVEEFGGLGDVGYFSIAQGITLTARMILGAPIVALGPNLSLEYARGRLEEVERKFEEAYRMMIPTYAFSFAVLVAFATPVLRVIYGADSVGATGYLQLLAFNVIFIVIPGIYTYIYLAADDARGLLYSSVLQVIIQNAWILVVGIWWGVIAPATVWIVYIPFFIAQHLYAKKKHGLFMKMRIVGSRVALGIVFAAGMIVLVDILEILVEFIPTIGIMQAAIVCLFIIPLWYIYITVSVLIGHMNKTDLENMISVLKIILPAWWVTKPLMVKLISLTEKREKKETMLSKSSS